VKQALKNKFSLPALEQRRAMTKQSVKDLHAQIQNNKELLAKLHPALELKKTRKAALEAELRTLTAEFKLMRRRWLNFSNQWRKYERKLQQP
jgi:chromosome segregation ATPase